MVSEDVLQQVRSHMQGLRPPGHYDKVHKEECMYSFDTPESPGGLYVNLKTFQVHAVPASRLAPSAYVERQQTYFKFRGSERTLWHLIIRRLGMFCTCTRNGTG